jgi:hypothetical protein
VNIGIMLANFAKYGCQIHIPSTQSARWVSPLELVGGVVTDYITARADKPTPHVRRYH